MDYLFWIICLLVTLLIFKLPIYKKFINLFIIPIYRESIRQADITPAEKVFIINDIVYDFVSRPLKPDELEKIDWEKLGVEKSRIPTNDNWSWTVDIKNEILYTQLISSSGVDGEQREGTYYYLLIIQGDPILIYLSGVGMRSSNNRHYAQACFIKSPILDKYQTLDLIKIVSTIDLIHSYKYYFGHRSFILYEELALKTFIL